MSTALEEGVQSASSGPVGDESPFRKAVRQFCRSKVAVFWFGFLVVIIICAILAPLIAPQDPYDLMQLDIMDGRLAPLSTSLDGDVYWLGTDDQGRDLFSGILYGLRISLAIGIGSALFAAIVGSFLGLTAAYMRGPVDTMIMRLVDLQLSFPAILVALVILVVLGKGVINVALALVFVEWAIYARTARGVALGESKKEYIQAAEGLSFSRRYILFRHLLPNCMPPLMVISTVQIARAIALEATLSFLGLGVPVTSPSLGLLVANGYRYLFAGDYWISVFPGLALLIVVFAFNIVGDRVREVLQPETAR